MIVNAPQHSRGMTLIELLLYILLTSVLIIALAAIGMNVFRVNVKAQSFEEVGYTSAFIFNALYRVADEAVGVTTPTGSATSSSISFVMSDTTKNPTVFEEIDGVLYYTEGSKSSQKIQPDGVVVDVMFTDVTAGATEDAVRVAMNIQMDTAAEAPQEFTLDANFYTTLIVRVMP